MRGPDPYSSDAYSSDANPQIDLTTPLPPRLLIFRRGYRKSASAMPTWAGGLSGCQGTPPSQEQRRPQKRTALQAWANLLDEIVTDASRKNVVPIKEVTDG